MTYAFNRDCMDAMLEFPDKFFDLAVVDPPYGGGAERERERELQGGRGPWDGKKRGRFGGWFSGYHIGDKNGRDLVEEVPAGTTKAADIRHWDVAPPPEYFDELARVSKHQIIWGGNYFALPATRCFIVWRKLNIPLEGFSMAPVEYAWTSFNDNAAMFEAFSSSMTGEEKRFHPTQKPVALYRWIYQHYAKPGYKILDTHLGSGSSRIAAYDAGLDFWGYEIDRYYFEHQEERFERHAAQGNLFLDP